MVKYISFHRALNVGGHNVIRMENLKKIYESAGMKNVKTFIQSGNVIFESDLTDDLISEKINRIMQKKAGFSSEIFLRTAPEITSIIKNDPFPEAKIDKITKKYLTFLPESPTSENSHALEILSYNAEKFRVLGREVYTLVIKNLIPGKALFNKVILDAKLHMRCTTRDWNTITKIKSII